MSSHPFRHFRLITKHRHQVISNGARCGIFWHCLKHDLSKYGYTEFHLSAKYYVGDHSPVFEERVHNRYFSAICQHHTKRNPHHWEYWVDFFAGSLVVKTMPWIYATEYVCDTLAAAKTYDPKNFGPSTALDYFMKHNRKYYMTAATREYIIWALTRYRDLGFAGLKKKDTKAAYSDIISSHPQVERFVSLMEGVESLELPPLKE